MRKVSLKTNLVKFTMSQDLNPINPLNKENTCIRTHTHILKSRYESEGRLSGYQTESASPAVGFHRNYTFRGTPGPPVHF